MKATPEKKKKLAKYIIGIVAVCIVIFLGVQNLGVIGQAASWLISLFIPLILGFVFALILNVPMSFFERHIWSKTKKNVLRKLRRPISFIISFILIIGVLVGVIWLVIPELIEAVKVIVQGTVDFIVKVNEMEEAELSQLPFGSLLLSIDWDKILDSLQNWLKNQSGTIVNTAVGTISTLVTAVFNLFVSIVFCIYILFSKEKLKAQSVRLIRAWIPQRFGEWFIHASSVASANFRNFVSGQSIEAVILGALCMVGMLILRIPYAPMVGALVGVTALIPVVGAFVGTIIGAFMILTVSPIKALVFVIFLLILQQIEGNLIYPKVMGSRVNLPGMWILAAVTVGGAVAGPVGMLLSVPISSTAYILIREATEKREAKMAQEDKDVE